MVPLDALVKAKRKATKVDKQQKRLDKAAAKAAWEAAVAPGSIARLRRLLDDRGRMPMGEGELALEGRVRAYLHPSHDYRGFVEAATGTEVVFCNLCGCRWAGGPLLALRVQCNPLGDERSGRGQRSRGMLALIRAGVVHRRGARLPQEARKRLQRVRG